MLLLLAIESMLNSSVDTSFRARAEWRKQLIESSAIATITV